MTMREHLHNVAVLPAIVPVAAAGTDDTPLVSDIIDTQGYDSLFFAIMTGTLADVDADFTVLIEDGDDSGLSDNAPVDDIYLEPDESVASFTFAEDDSIRRIAYTGPKRYVRMTITPANNTGAAPIVAVAVLGRPHEQPQPSNA